MVLAARHQPTLFPLRGSAQGSLCVGRAFGPPHRPHVLEGRRIFFHVFSRIPRLRGRFGGPLYTLFHVFADNFGAMGEALFTLFAVFGPLLGQGAGVS